MWSGLIEIFELAIFLAGQTLGGSLASGVFAVTAVVRLAALPLTYRMAKAARVRQTAIGAIKDEVAGLREQWASDPQRLFAETQALYERHGLKLVDASSLKLAAIQMPLVLALFQAVRRVIAGSPLASASLPVALIASCFASASVLAGSHNASGTVLAGVMLVAAAGAGVLAFTLGSGFGFYSIAFQSVSTIQGLLLRRADRKALQPG